MAFLTADVVANPGGKEPFKVIVQQGTNILAEWDVKTKAEGEEQILTLVQEALDDEEGEAEGAADK